MRSHGTQRPQRTQRQIWVAALIAACVTASGLRAQQTAASITIFMTDHHFRLTAPVERGPLTWHLKNDGSEPHQALVVRLPEGVTDNGEESWFEHGGKGPEPGERVGGVETLEPGAETSFRTDLKPGRYLLLCAKSEDEGRHYELGMVYRFEIE